MKLLRRECIAGLLFILIACSAEEPPESADQFHVRILTMLPEVEKNGQIADDAMKLMLSRLKSDFAIEDGLIWKLANAVEANDFNRQNKEELLTKSKYNKSLSFLSSILEAKQLASKIRIKLLNKKAGLLNLVEKRDEAILYLEEAHALALVETNELQLASNLLKARLATEYRMKNKKREALALFREVLSYPWYVHTKQPEMLQKSRDSYLVAARGTIDCLRDDLEELKQLRFFPATHQELRDYLEQAIIDAGGDPKLAPNLKRMKEFGGKNE